MANFKFGQLRKSQFNNYVTDLSYTLDNFITKATFAEGIYFQDKQIKLLNEVFEPITGSGTSIKSYYIKLKIKKTTDIQEINIKLYNSTKQEDNEQMIDQITIPILQPNTSEYIFYETVFKPNNTYDSICISLIRTQQDYNIVIDADAHLYGRILDITVEKMQNVNNLIDSISNLIDNKKLLKQIGIQGNSGLLMCINGEPIRIGRTGIYEINYGVSISFLGFIIQHNDDNINFILDYQY